MRVSNELVASPWKMSNKTMEMYWTLAYVPTTLTFKEVVDLDKELYLYLAVDLYANKDAGLSKYVDVGDSSRGIC